MVSLPYLILKIVYKHKYGAGKGIYDIGVIYGNGICNIFCEMV